ncbi:MAG: cytochrome c biogenesis protein ResB, partial [Verrucomicrobia bacterium]|nr:cytochrome c biogenesis protein ResB [Verrucomicrobiota bacterium]
MNVRNVTTDQPTKASERVMHRVREALSSVKFAVTVVGIIAAACVAGTLLPQGAEVAGYVQRNPEASGRMEFLAQLGLTHVYSSWWFIALLGLLAACVATCSTSRFATFRRTRGFAQRRALGSLLAHISILLILAGGVIRGLWAEKGHLEFRQGDLKAEFVVENGIRRLPFTLQLAKFEIETYDQPKSSDKVSRPANEENDQLLVRWPQRNLTAKLPVRVGVEQVVAPQGERLT